jgi:hypothetical protein
MGTTAKVKIFCRKNWLRMPIWVCDGNQGQS